MLKETYAVVLLTAFSCTSQAQTGETPPNLKEEAAKQRPLLKGHTSESQQRLKELVAAKAKKAKEEQNVKEEARSKPEGDDSSQE